MLADDINEIHVLVKQGKLPEEIAAKVGLEIGDVQTILAGGLALPPAAPVGEAAPVGGVQVHRLVFQHDTPGLSAGVPIFTPSVGDILLDAWIEVDVAWDGTTPTGDIGTTTDGNNIGWMQNVWMGVQMTNADDTWDKFDASLLAQPSGPFGTPSPPLGPTGLAAAILMERFHTFAEYLGAGSSQPAPTDGFRRWLPAKFVRSEPVRVVVSQSGLFGGADSSSTQGSATAYVTVATPQ